MANANQFGGRYLIQDSNHLVESADEGGRFMIQDHDHLSGVVQSNAGGSVRQSDQAESSDRQQGDGGKKTRRPGRQFL